MATPNEKTPPSRSTVPLRVSYTLAPQWNAQQWMDGVTPLQTAMGLTHAILEGSVPKATWDALAPILSWTRMEDGTIHVRTDAVPVKTWLNGTVNLICNNSEPPQFSVVFDFQENQKTWYAREPYTNMESLLQDLAQQTRNDLANPEVQQELGCELEVILNSLWHASRLEHSPRQGISHTPAAHPEEQDWRTIEMDALLQEFEEPEPYMDDPALEQLQVIVEKHALGMAQVMAPYHQQMHQIAWTMISATSTIGEPFVWSSEQPLHWEVIRTLYYITQGFYLIEDRGPIPWLDQSPQYSDAVDLSFLQTRALALSHSLRPSAQARNQFHPGELTQTPQRIMELKSFGEKKYPKQTNDAALTTAWHVSALMEYADRFLPGMEKLKWNLTTCRGLLQDKKQRESILQGFAAAQLNHGSALDITIQFWEHGPFAAYGGTEGTAAKHALWLLKGYFTWKEAKDKGYSAASMPVFSMDNIADVANRVRNTEAGKKMDPYFRILGNYTPDRYFVAPPVREALDTLLVKFPNFAEVTRMLQKTMGLLQLQETPTLRLPNILLVGDPGLGKTRYLNALAKVLSAPIHEIAMSTVSASFVLAGSDMTWHSAKPGRIANAFLYDVCANPLFILDEIDKASGSQAYDPYGPLYQLLERHTAERFQDEALQLEMNASACSWLATANDVRSIPEPILSRFRVHRIPALTSEQVPAVAQSIYDDVRSSNAWGKFFHPELQSAAFTALMGLDARAMYFALMDACANASDRPERPIVLQSNDFIYETSGKPRPGFY